MKGYQCARQSARCAGIWHCGNTIIKEEGVRSLWKGLTPFAVHLTLKYALRMGTNAFYQSLLRDKVRSKLQEGQLFADPAGASNLCTVGGSESAAGSELRHVLLRNGFGP